MLLHNLYINVAFPVVLSLKLSLYDLQEPKYKNLIYATEGNLENVPCRVVSSDTNYAPRLFWVRMT